MRLTTITQQFVHGAVSLEPIGDGLKPWRIPWQDRVLFFPEEGIQAKAEMPAGVRVRFHAATSAIELTVAPAERERLFDLVAGRELRRTVTLPAGADVVRFDDLRTTSQVYEIWLPTQSPVVLRTLGIDSATEALPVPDSRPRWLAYGSSITHCEEPNSPARAWPALAARIVDVNLTCLGFGGNCMLEPAVAMFIRDLEADIITMKLGINVHGQSSLSARTYQPAVIGFVRILREKHRRTPIGVVTPISCPKREGTPNAVKRTLEDYRRDTAEAVRRLREHGDGHLLLFDGRDLLGESDAGHLADGLHPDGDGYELIGRRAASIILPRLLEHATQGD